MPPEFNLFPFSLNCTQDVWNNEGFTLGWYASPWGVVFGVPVPGVSPFADLQEHIAKIVSTYQFRKEAPRYSRRVQMDEIVKNDFNLNISRYISTAVGADAINLLETHAELMRIEDAINAAARKHNAFLQELNLPLLPS